IAPRPIALASTIDRQGNINLSPFSFFNVFSANPPILIFSPSRRVRDNTTKHTLENVLEVPEVVINVVTYNIVEQTSLASTEYDKGVNEFVKAGFTAIPSEKVKPPRVKESPVQFECIVREVKPLGTEGGAGNLVLSEVLCFHVHPSVLDEKGKIDTRKMDLVARMGGDWYCRAYGNAIFEVEKPIAKKGIGIDQLPDNIRTSHYLTGNQLARLANIEKIPDKASLASIAVPKREALHPHQLAAQLLDEGNLLAAWKVLLQH
ncbi:MAG: flavin reductase family protein, partial [Flammeovirgaceae bacterium]|nr:flavin reductase family protein [Flammeovirgaceae bacterium]MDW8288322.1 flavin reductase family protein [Flammeovirgaceae bacterium]